MRLPSMRHQQVVRALEKIGFKELRQTGSHLILANLKIKKIIPIPMHAKDVKRDLMFSIIKQSGLTVDQFIKLL